MFLYNMLLISWTFVSYVQVTHLFNVGLLVHIGIGQIHFVYIYRMAIIMITLGP